MTDKERDKAFKAATRDALKQRTRIQTDTRDEIVRLLKLAQTQIATTLAGQPSDYQRWNLTNLSKEINRVLAEFGEAGAATISTAAGVMHQAGQELIDKPLAAGGISLSGVAPVLDVTQLNAMRSFMSDRIKDIGVQAANKINTQLGLVVIGAQSPGDAIGEVQKILGDPSRSRATTIVRTELGRVYAMAAQQRKAQAVAHVPGLKKMWRRSGKIHSRLHHDAADGQVQDVEDPYQIHSPRGLVEMMYPHDPAAPASEVINCGCVSVPHMASWDLSAPGRKPYSNDELAQSPTKRAINDALKGPTLRQLMDQVPEDKLQPMSDIKPERTPWGDFPDVVIQQTESAVKQHPSYEAAKSGDIDAALQLVQDSMPQAALDALQAQLAGKTPIVAGVQAVENMSVNVIPEVMAAYVADSLGLPLDDSLTQINRVGHTGSSGFKRLATPALFDGAVQAGQDYLVVDDFVGQGGTLANLRGHIEQNGGNVLMATVLTGKPYSAKLALTSETLAALRAKHGKDLEDWWRQQFGYGFELLTESEARYLLNTKDADKVRAGLSAAVQDADP